MHTHTHAHIHTYSSLALTHPSLSVACPQPCDHGPCPAALDMGLARPLPNCTEHSFERRSGINLLSLTPAHGSLDPLNPCTWLTQPTQPLHMAHSTHSTPARGSLDPLNPCTWLTRSLHMAHSTPAHGSLNPCTWLAQPLLMVRSTPAILQAMLRRDLYRSKEVNLKVRWAE